MAIQQLIRPDQCSIVEVRKGDSWVRFALWLAEEFTGGELIRFVEEARFSVEGADELSASYSRTNWTSGVASGALYAFRALQIPRQRVILGEFAGRLRASEMEAVADGAVIAIAKLAQREIPPLQAIGWDTHVEILPGRLPAGVVQAKRKGQQPQDNATPRRKISHDSQGRPRSKKGRKGN